MYRFLVIFLLSLSVHAASGQAYSTGSKKALKRFEAAVELYRAMDYPGAEDMLLEALEADDEFVEAYQLLAQICMDSDRLEEAIAYYSKTLEIDPEGNPEAYRLLAGMRLRNGEYELSLELLEKYLGLSPPQQGSLQSAYQMQEKCLFALEAMRAPVPFVPENLGEAVNSHLNEYWPALSVDEKLLMFTVMVPLEEGQTGRGRQMQEDFYFSENREGSWTPRQVAGPPLNTLDNEGAHSMTADGRILCFTACNRRDGLGQCDLYFSRWKDDRWSAATNLGSPVNSRYSEKHPSMSADGRIIYFASNRPGGSGNYDIWMSRWDGREWSTPQNLGDSVNTPGSEQSPFLHPDGRTLFFSSTGWPGMGQGDLFQSRKDAGGGWSAAKNLGYPINTYHDEIGLSVSAGGSRAYFASDRDRKDTDLYTFELPESLRPVTVSYMSGRVYDAVSGKGLASVIQLTDLESREVVSEIHTSGGDGSYLVSLPTDRDYALTVSARDYLFHSAHFSFTGEHSRQDPFRKDIPLERISAGKKVVLNNIFFEVDSDSLLPASVVELRKVESFLQGHPEVHIEIGGHTDHSGSASHNLALSQRRAEAVKAYLAGRGIDSGRMSTRGYGDSQPLQSNDTEEGRASNRRTEMKIAAQQP